MLTMILKFIWNIIIFGISEGTGLVNAPLAINRNAKYNAKYYSCTQISVRYQNKLEQSIHRFSKL